MNGFFERLAQRARGGAALAGLPLVRPLPTLYQGAPREKGAEDLPFEIEVETTAPPRPALSEQLPADQPQQAPATWTAARIQAERVVGATQVRPPDAGAPMAATDALRPPATTRSAAPSPVLEDSALPAGRRQEVGPAPSGQDRRSPPAEPSPSPVQPAIATSLERVFAVIESSPSAGYSPAPWEDDSPDSGAAAPPPAVSIGRIDIVVAPPPVIAAPAERTRGFQNYARLRRGLAR